MLSPCNTREVTVFAMLVLLLCLLGPSTDIDRDGYSASQERAYGCDPFDAASMPYCLPGSEIPGACSANIPGTALYPCQLTES
jgi:hypothetical protein